MAAAGLYEEIEIDDDISILIPQPSNHNSDVKNASINTHANKTSPRDSPSVPVNTLKQPVDFNHKIRVVTETINATLPSMPPAYIRRKRRIVNDDDDNNTTHVPIRMTTRSSSTRNNPPVDTPGPRTRSVTAKAAGEPRKIPRKGLDRLRPTGASRPRTPWDDSDYEDGQEEDEETSDDDDRDYEYENTSDEGEDDDQSSDGEDPIQDSDLEEEEKKDKDKDREKNNDKKDEEEDEEDRDCDNDDDDDDDYDDSEDERQNAAANADLKKFIVDDIGYTTAQKQPVIQQLISCDYKVTGYAGDAWNKPFAKMIKSTFYIQKCKPFVEGFINSLGNNGVQKVVDFGRHLLQLMESSMPSDLKKTQIDAIKDKCNCCNTTKWLTVSIHATVGNVSKRWSFGRDCYDRVKCIASVYHHLRFITFPKRGFSIFANNHPAESLDLRSSKKDAIIDGYNQFTKLMKQAQMMVYEVNTRYQ